MGKKVLAMFAALMVFLVIASTVMNSVQMLAILPSGGVQNLSGYPTWLLSALRYGSLAAGLVIAAFPARRVIRWGFAPARA